jgi:SSS family solute:Na+ symporter
MELNRNRLNMFLPKSDTVLPWTALLLGLWIPNFYYWGLNQYITQRTLGSSSLAEGQKGIVFAAYLKLIIPFVVVIPGIIAFNLFHGDMQLKAQGDIAQAMGIYVKANPQTRFVEVREGLQQNEIDTHEGPIYLISLYDSPSELTGLSSTNPFVLTMLKSEYESLQPERFQLFSAREDHAWKHVNPGLALEIQAYNQQVEQAADAAGESPSSQALVAYKYDTALGLLLGSVLPKNVGILGFVLAGLLGAVVSSLAAMLNAASTIFTMDICNKYIVRNASQNTIVLLGRSCVVVFAVTAFFLAPQLGNPNISNSIFTIIQESQGLISPGILAVFVIGLLIHKAPRTAGTAGLLTSIVCYAGLKFLAPSIQFLNRMAIVFGLCIVVMLIMTAMKPLREAVVLEARTALKLETSRGAMYAGIICIFLTLLLYVIFSPLLVAG